MTRQFLFSGGKLAKSTPDPDKQNIRKEKEDLAPWKILIVDDDQEVHDVTRLTLGKLRFRDRPLKFLDAGSIPGTKEIFAGHQDIAVVFLDVVMETEHAGLELARYIREDLGNRTTRIILRTGQPGQAPEEDVILNYDINDYKAKTDLTSQKLRTTTISALRGYEHIIALEENRRNLAGILDIANALFHHHSIDSFAPEALERICNFLSIPSDGVLCTVSDGSEDKLALEVIAASGDFASQKADPGAIFGSTILEVSRSRTNSYQDSHAVLLIPGNAGKDVYCCLARAVPEHKRDPQMIDLLCGKIATGFENVHLYEALTRTNLELEDRVHERTRELEKANSELTRLATTDALTGAANRRFLMEKGQQELERARRYGHPLSILIFDIDFFKKINDEFGHLIGDDALRELVRRCQSCLRDQDLLGRYGGEEFVVLLPETPLETARVAAERLREEVAQIRIDGNGQMFGFTISLGVAELQDSTMELQELFSHADQALYSAKENGRNRTVLFSG